MTRLFVYAAAMHVLLMAVTHPPNTQQAPVFRGGVELLTLDVRVLDSDGRPVTGLGAGDFVVELDGKKQPVRVVDYREYAGAGVVPELVDAADPTTRGRSTTTETEATGRAVLVMIDDLSFRPEQSRAFVATARRLISSLGGQDQVELATTSGQAPAAAMSRNKTRALLALNTISGRRIDSAQDGSSQRVNGGAGTEVVISSADALAIQAGNDSVFGDVTQRICGRRLPRSGPLANAACPIAVRTEAMQQAAMLERTSTSQMESLREIIETLGLEAPPRILVLLSAGVETDSNRAIGLEALRSAVVGAGVQVHVLTPGMGTATDAADRTALRSQIRRENDEFSRRGIELVAGMLSSEIYRVVGGPDRLLDRLLVGWSGIYRVGVDRPAVARTGPVRVAVTVRRPGANVSAAKFVRVSPAAGPTADAPVAAAAPSREATLAHLVDDGGSATGVPMTLGVVSKRDESGRDVQIVTVEVPAGVGAPLSGLFAATDNANRVIQRGTLSFAPPAPGDDYRVSVVVPVPPGEYRVRVAVADAAGAVGAVEHTGAARLSRLRSSTVSDLLLSWIGDDGKARFVAMEALPEPARILQASLEFYSTSPSAGTAVRMALFREGVPGPVAEAQALPVKMATGWRLGVSVPLATLEAGVYVVRATIREGTDPPLTISRTVRKLAPRK